MLVYFNMLDMAVVNRVKGHVYDTLATIKQDRLWNSLSNSSIRLQSTYVTSEVTATIVLYQLQSSSSHDLLLSPVPRHQIWPYEHILLWDILPFIKISCPVCIIVNKKCHVLLLQSMYVYKWNHLQMSLFIFSQCMSINKKCHVLLPPCGHSMVHA